MFLGTAVSAADVFPAKIGLLEPVLVIPGLPFVLGN